VTELPAEPTAQDLEPTWFIDSDSEAVREFVERVTGDETNQREIARRLFAAVRDELRYDPYAISGDPDDYRASAVLAAGRGYCVPKAVVLTAAARAAGIPARLGYADVKNHLQSERLREQMGTDLFVWHGYSLLHLGGHWAKASPAFNKELCERFGVEALDFDGTEDALLHPFTGDGRRHMEYVNDRGAYQDLPLQTILEAYKETYRHTAQS
jgi:transglutaminase-like putative cysteine protease